MVACRWASLKWAGAVITALLTGCPRKTSADRRSVSSTIAEICERGESVRE